MAFNVNVPSPNDNIAAILAQLLLNDQINQLVDNNAVLDTGIVRGNVVKYSSSLQKWVLYDGTTIPGNTDTIGIVEYAGSPGQVKSSGIYLDTDLTETAPYYCQSDGSLGTTVTKLFMGRIVSTGLFIIASGLGATINPATETILGGVKIPANSGLHITIDGSLSVNHGQQMFTSSGTWTCPSGVTTVHVDGAGGGGGGGGGKDGGSGFGGGGADACKDKEVSVTPGTTYPVTIGAGGNGGSDSGHAGTATSFGSLLTLSGGGAGLRSAAGAAGGLGGTEGSAYGGGSMFGAGGNGDADGGGLYGAGGAGGVGAGGAGAQGFLTIKW